MELKIYFEKTSIYTKFIVFSIRLSKGWTLVLNFASIIIYYSDLLFSIFSARIQRRYITINEV